MTIIEQKPLPVDEFETWLKARPRWLQTAARLMIDEKRRPTEDEFFELARLCKLEAKGETDPQFRTIVEGSFAQAAVRPQLRIEEVVDVHGVNAIKAGAGLPFGSGNLTVIYGQNGTGKSGFARLLKQVCGSRSKDDILSNVFEENPPGCRAKLTITVDGKPEDVHWDILSGPHKALRYAQIFDTKAAAQYMGRTEASYEPSRMKFVSSLIATADAVSALLSREKDAHPKALPSLPAELLITAEGKWLTGLKATTAMSSIDQASSYDEQLDRERIESEALLAEKDVTGRLALIGKEKTALQSIRTTLSHIKTGTSDAVAMELAQLKARATIARRSSEEAAFAAFGNAELEGVGSTTWQQMWEQARLYSISAAYPDLDFPVVGQDSRCVLCQQTLNEDAQRRLHGFEQFVTAGLETAAKTAEKSFADRVKRLPMLPSSADWIVHTSTLGFEEAESPIWLQELASRRIQLSEGQQTEVMTTFDWSKLDAAVEAKSASLLTEETSLKALQNNEHRQMMQSRVLQLRAKQWLHQNKAAILEEKTRLTTVALIDKACRSTATNTLTTKKNELARSELDAGYQTRFTAELRYLGGNRIPVLPQSRSGGKGKITFGLNLVGAFGQGGPDVILSEGETRIVSLAAFLADTTGSNQLAPFIFDDPISSLDQDFEEKVVERLLALSHTRQVVIFTHRLSLVAMVDSTVKRWADNTSIPKITHSVKTLRRLDKTAGIVTAQSARDLRPDRALRGLSDQAITKLRKFQDQGDVDGYDQLAKTACSDFRVIIEKTVEFVLLADVVGRFRRAINTQGKIHNLAKVTSADCHFIDDLMTRYSVFEHAQSEEQPSAALEFDVFENDVKALSEWITEFQARSA